MPSNSPAMTASFHGMPISHAIGAKIYPKIISMDKSNPNWYEIKPRIELTIYTNAITAIKAEALDANTTAELLTQPLIVVGGTTLTIKAGSADSFDFGVSYLNIKKEVTT